MHVQTQTDSTVHCVYCVRQHNLQKISHVWGNKISLSTVFPLNEP